MTNEQQQALYTMVFNAIDDETYRMARILAEEGYPQMNIAVAITVALGSLSGMLAEISPLSPENREGLYKRIAENVKALAAGPTTVVGPLTEDGLMSPADDDMPDNVIPFPVQGTRLPRETK